MIQINIVAPPLLYVETMSNFFDFKYFSISIIVCLIFISNGRAGFLGDVGWLSTSTSVTVLTSEGLDYITQENKEEQQLAFVEVNHNNLLMDMARGEGEHLSALAYLYGCPIEVHEEYAQMAQHNFKQIFPSSQMESKNIVSNLESKIMKNPLLAKECKWNS